MIFLLLVLHVKHLFPCSLLSIISCNRMLVLSCFIFNLGGCLKLCGKGKVLYMVNRLYKKVITPGAGYMHFDVPSF